MTCSKKIRPITRAIEHVGQRELGLQDRQRVAVAGGPVVPIQRMRQSCQPLTQQPINLALIKPIADSLQRLRVLAGKNAVVQHLEEAMRRLRSWHLAYSLPLAGVFE
jgi:hypothetical protein